MRSELQRVLSSLLEQPQGRIGLNQVAFALGSLAVSHEDIDWLIGELEGAGREVDIAGDVGGAEALRRALSSARALRAQGERATLQRIGEHSGLSREAVLTGLALARVLQR